MTGTLQMTAAEFIAAPVPSHGRPWNLIDGAVIVTDPTWLHASTQANILRALFEWTSAEAGRGTASTGVDIGIDERNVYVPDVLWYRDGRVPSRDSAPAYAVPDLAVEVRSPSTWRYDIDRKRTGYERAGLPELWLVDTVAETVLVYRRASAGHEDFDLAAELSAGETLTSPLLAGFSMPVEQVFAA